MKVIVSRNLFIVVIVDTVLLCCSFYLAHVFRFDFVVPDWAIQKFWKLLPIIILVKLGCLYFFDSYRGMWRYTGLNDLMNVVKASVVSSISLIVLILFSNRFEMVSRSVLVIDWCLTVISIISVRILIRLCFEAFTETISLDIIIKTFFKIFKKNNGGPGRRVIIIGAGDCGQKICREFLENPHVTSRVVGFLDDDVSKIGRKIHGVAVLDAIIQLELIVKVKAVDEVLIAIPSASAGRMRKIVNLCKKSDVEFKTVPDLGEVIDGKINISSIRQVEYRDLLGREPVFLDKKKIGGYLSGKTVMVTGAAGSIGTGLSRQICRYQPLRIVLFERAESPLYAIDLELKKSFFGVEVIPVLGDIQDKKELFLIFDRFKPDIVFHAAAYKHVPMLEVYPWKAVQNNVFGTKNLIEVTKAFKCERFVFVSTDKAVNPTNVMGTSKRISELLVQEISCDAGSQTSFMTVRFGNVIGSVGSVIPLFKRQIKEGGPVTVTHKDMARYFMLIPEACQLILQAGAMGKGGETFVLEMGDPVKIDSMARDLIRFSGFEPDVDIKIQYTGLRPGEKLYEELMTDKEEVVPTGHKKIMVLNTNCVNMKVLNGKLGSLKEMAGVRDGEGIRKIMKVMVPEYRET